MTLAEIKERLRAGREEIKEAHRRHGAGAMLSPRDAADTGSAGPIAGALTDLSDWAVEQAYRPALEELPLDSRAWISAQLSLVAVGGYGRGDLAPYSDIDLLFLTTAAAASTQPVRDFVSRLVRDLWDVGLKLSSSMRTVTECLAAARRDLTFRTALPDARLLLGEAGQVSELRRQVHRLFASTSVNQLIAGILSERAREHYDYHAQTVLLLEPNVKKSPGGLRDIHMLRWIALARYGTQDLKQLHRESRINEPDLAVLIRGREFLQQIRHELHFQAGSAEDVLTLDEQVRLAGWMGFEDEGSLLGVERFMRHYYRQTTGINDVVMRFVENARSKSALGRLIAQFAARRVEQHFRLGRTGLAIASKSKETVLGSATLILHLFDCARGYGVAVERESVEQIRAVADRVEMPQQARLRFLALLDHPPGLDYLLRGLHQVGFLSRLVPAFDHARCLIQFNLYHKFTVDEHTLRAVASAVRRRDERTSLGQAYREIHRKDLLHLALLLHDLGKGLGADHCSVGRDLAEATARDFGLGDHERRLLTFLVERHLLMAQTAFRRDLGDDATIVQFARAVATPEVLRMMYVLTAADTEAVSPGNWTAWKESLLNELYFRTTEELTGDAPADDSSRGQQARMDLARALGRQFPAEWLEHQLALMPDSYLRAASPPSAARHMQVLREMNGRPVRVVAEYLAATNSVEYTVFTRDDLTEGIFSKITGVLAAEGIQIISARILTRPDGLVMDTFNGQDSTFTGPPPPDRLQEVAGQIEAVLLGRLPIENLLARRRLSVGLSNNGPIRTPPQVETDNETSSRFTILEVFAEDRLGLLYTITRSLFELGLSVHSAKISTHADQVIDAFYVTARDGKKITDGDYLEHVRLQLLKTVETG